MGLSNVHKAIQYNVELCTILFFLLLYHRKRKNSALHPAHFARALQPCQNYLCAS